MNSALFAEEATEAAPRVLMTLDDDDDEGAPPVDQREDKWGPPGGNLNLVVTILNTVYRGEKGD
eukprot:685215-Prorocentrum_minimum.AAC.1